MPKKIFRILISRPVDCYTKINFISLYCCMYYCGVNWLIARCVNGGNTIFQRLVYRASPYTQLIWLQGQARSVPQGAIIGSHIRDGAPPYLIRAEGTSGCYDSRKSFAEYEAWGPKSAEKFDYLILKFCMCIFIRFSTMYPSTDDYTRNDLIHWNRSCVQLTNQYINGSCHMYFFFNVVLQTYLIAVTRVIAYGYYPLH